MVSPAESPLDTSVPGYTPRGYLLHCTRVCRPVSSAIGNQRSGVEVRQPDVSKNRREVCVDHGLSLVLDSEGTRAIVEY